MDLFRIHSLDAWDWEALPVTVESVYGSWRAALRAQAPWREMLADDAPGNMRPVISELLNEARHPSDGTRAVRLRRSARNHGVFRRNQRLDDDALAWECEVLAHALESALLGSGLAPSFVRDSLIVLRPDLEAVRDAAMLGWAIAEPAGDD